MSPEAQRIAIAKICDWYIKPDMIVGGYLLRNKKSRESTSFWSDPYMHEPPILEDIINQLPDYLKDLNAIHKAWKQKIEGNAVLEDAYTYYLLEVCNLNCSGSPESPDYSTADIAIISNANATQRVEAFLKTLKLWDDTK